MARYACSDLHGRYDLAEQVIAHLNPSDTLYFLGDAIDRGPSSWETLMLMLTHPQVEFFLGNHEDFLCKAHHEERTSVIIDRYQYLRSDVTKIWSYNGGEEMIRKCADLRERDPETLQLILSLLDAAHIEEFFTNDRGQNLHLTHAGYSPDRRPFDNEELIWNRSHIYRNWPENPAYENIYMIHGHTPIDSVCDYDENREVSDGPLSYCGGHKIDIDLGSALYGWTTMLNLDTFEYINIEGDHQYDLR